jgi:hypothetical protein
MTKVSSPEGSRSYRGHEGVGPSAEALLLLARQHVRELVVALPQANPDRLTIDDDTGAIPVVRRHGHPMPARLGGREERVEQVERPILAVGGDAGREDARAFAGVDLVAGSLPPEDLPSSRDDGMGSGGHRRALGGAGCPSSACFMIDAPDADGRASARHTRGRPARVKDPVSRRSPGAGWPPVTGVPPHPTAAAAGRCGSCSRAGRCHRTPGGPSPGPWPSRPAASPPPPGAGSDRR